MSGIDDTGLTIELIPDIRSGIETDFRNTFGSSLPLGDKTVLGHWAGIVAERVGLAWERLEQVYSSQDADKATGAGLDALASLTGTLRLAPVPSTVTETLCGDPGTVIASGALISTNSSGNAFQTAADATLAALAAWVAATIYSVGDQVTNTARCYRCIAEGVSAGSGGPTSTATDITDGTVHWQYLGEGTATDDVATTSVASDAIVASAYDLTVIQTPVFGWKSALNLLDAALGRGTQSDQSLRVLREAELSGNGASTSDAIRAAILKLSNVVSCSVVVNRTDVTDGDGRPPHTFECLVDGGADQDVIDAIGDELPVGIGTHGSTSGTYVDSQGTSVPINFSRPIAVLIYLRVNLTYNANVFPADGNSEIKVAIDTAAQETYAIDLDVDPSFISAQAFQVPGLLGVQEVSVYNDVIGTPVAWVGTTGYSATPGARSVVTNDGRTYICITSGTSGSGGPTGTGTDITDGAAHWRWLGNPVSIDAHSIAVFDTTRMTVTSTPATP